MIDLIEVFDRADNGPLISDTDYYLGRFVPKLAEVIGRYKIKWDKNTIVNTDDDLADRVFQAAVDLLVEAGAYCSDTNRVMEFSKDGFRGIITVPYDVERLKEVLNTLLG